MAMEKLILRSVLYGADKIPDKWFEKIPGGFYKKQELQDRQDRQDQQKQNSKGGSKGRSNDTSDGRRARNEVLRNDGYRSDGGRRRHERRSSYDGGADDDDQYASRDDRPRRSKSHRRRRSTDDDRYGYDDGHGRRPRDDYHDDRRKDGTRAYSPSPDYGRRRSHAKVDGARNQYEPRPFEPGPFATAAAAEAATAAAGGQRHRSANASPIPNHSPLPQHRSDRVSSGYVPYADVYGNGAQPSPRQHAHMLPSEGSAQPKPRQQRYDVAAPPQGYRQNPYAQEAPTAADAGAGAAYMGQSEFMPLDPSCRSGSDPRLDPRNTPRRPYGQDRRKDDQRTRDERGNNDGKSKSKNRDTQPSAGNRRKDGQQNSEYERDAKDEGGNARKRRDDGYYSD